MTCVCVLVLLKVKYMAICDIATFHLIHICHTLLKKANTCEINQNRKKPMEENTMYLSQMTQKNEKLVHILK